MKPKIVFIHGMFLTAKCWEHWISYFENLGYPCVAPPWPLHEAEPAALREDVPTGLGTLSLTNLHEHFSRVVRNEDEPPVAIGHSLGGLLVQKLMAEGLLRAGVGICPVAPNKMMAADWGFLRNTLAIANPFAGDEPFEMTAEGFQKNFANTWDEAASRQAFERYAVHESRQVLRDILGDEGKIDMDAPHAPLLLVGAEQDEIIPAPLVRRNAHAYGDERSFHDFTEFSGRSHFLIGERGWEEVAETIAHWLEAHLTETRA